MNHQWDQKKFNEIIAEIQKRSVTDPELRVRALSDAAAVIEEVAGEPLPSGVKLRFVNQLAEVVIVLPSGNSEELGESELENVAGGLMPSGGGSFTLGACAMHTLGINCPPH